MSALSGCRGTKAYFVEDDLATRNAKVIKNARLWVPDKGGVPTEVTADIPEGALIVLPKRVETKPIEHGGK